MSFPQVRIPHAATLALALTLALAPAAPALAEDQQAETVAPATAAAATVPAPTDEAAAPAPAAVTPITGVTLSRSSVYSGETVTVTPNGTGDNPTFNYVWSRNGSWKQGEWDSTKCHTGVDIPDASWDFTPDGPGTYTIYLDVTENGVKRTYSATLTVTQPFSLTSVATSASTVTLGGSVTVTPELSGDASRATFNYVWSRNGSWKQGEWDSTKRQSGVDIADKSWAFTPDRSGDYTLYVDAVFPDGRRETKSATVKVVQPFSFSSVSVSSSSVTVGDSVTVTPKLSGDASRATFNYVWSRNGSWKQGEWDSTKRQSGVDIADKSWTFTPDRSGTYTLYVDVVYPDGVRETKSATVKVDLGWSVGNISTSVASPCVKGTTISYWVPVSGPRAKSVHYNYVWQRGNSWAADCWGSTGKATGSFTTDTKGSFLPTISGNYTLYIDVIDDVTGEKVTRKLPFTIQRGWSATLDTSAPGASGRVRPGESVTLKPKVSGNAPGVTFNYVWSLNSWQSWNSTIKSTGKATTATSTKLTCSAPGWYEFYVDVIDKYGEKVTLSIPNRHVYSAATARNAVVAAAESQVGNANPYAYNRAILDAGGSLCWGQTNAWCASLVYWSYVTTGYADIWCGGKPLSEPAQIRDWYAARGRYHRSMYGVEPGDVIFFSYWVRGGEEVTHAGVCVGVSGSTVWVVDGNPGCAKNARPMSYYAFRGYADMDF